MNYYSGPILDAHMHLWDYHSGNYPWLDSDLPGADKMLGNYYPLRRNYLVNDYLKDIKEMNIKNSVHIQVFGYPNNPSAETHWVQTQADKTGYPGKIIGYIDLTQKNVEEEIFKHKQFSHFRGIRNVLCYHDDPELRMIPDKEIFANKKWLNGYSLLAKHALSFDTQIFDGQILELIKAIDKYPNINVMINHFAWPTDFSKAGFSKWKKNIALLKNFDNVFMKISAIGCVFKRLDKGVIRPYFEELLNIIGVDRCCIGSNFPVDGLFFSFKELYDFYKNLLANLSQIEQKKLFYSNTNQFYRIN